MLRYLDFPPTPAADATRVCASDREQPITSILIVPTIQSHDIPSSSSSTHSQPFYWQIWLGLPQNNRFVILDMVRRGICCGQLVATTVEHPPPLSHLPFQMKLVEMTMTSVRDVFKLVYDYAMDCYAFEVTAGRGRRYWISSVLKHFEACGIIVPGSSLEVYNYFAYIAKTVERVDGDGAANNQHDDDDYSDDDMGGVKSWSRKRDSGIGASCAWPIIGGHWLAPREVRPLAIARRPRLPCEIHGTGYRMLQYPFHESADAKEHDPHSRWFSSANDKDDGHMTHPDMSRSNNYLPPIQVYHSDWCSPRPSPLPFVFTSF